MNKIFYILFFTVLFSFSGLAQKTTLPADTYVKFMRFYPNPAVSSINFEFQKGFDKFFSLQVFNFIGKKIVDLKTVLPKINIDLSDFYRGVYIYQLRDKTGKIVESGKFQVVK